MLNKNIFFDHTYSEDKNHKFWKFLGECGFTLVQRAVEHPGALCTFIHFKKPRYLEFSSEQSPKDTRLKSGFSFGYKKNLKLYFKKIKTNDKYKVYFAHKNYNWKENSTDILPGWNFVDFRKQNLEGISLWFTEYEKRPKAFKYIRENKHPNGVKDIVGHEFEINAKGRVFFENILNTKIKDKIVLADGTIFYFRKGKLNLHKKVILGTKNLNKTKTFLKKYEDIVFENQNACLIKNPSKYDMWDILIIKMKS